jgi:hypothetical protein
VSAITIWLPLSRGGWLVGVLLIEVVCRRSSPRTITASPRAGLSSYWIPAVTRDPFEVRALGR